MDLTVCHDAYPVPDGKPKIRKDEERGNAGTPPPVAKFIIEIQGRFSYTPYPKKEVLIKPSFRFMMSISHNSMGSGALMPSR